jgi:hypothetical protein
MQIDITRIENLFTISISHDMALRKIFKIYINSKKHVYIILDMVFNVRNNMKDSSYINSKLLIIRIFKNINILTQKNSNNKILWRKIFNLHKCFIKFKFY